MTYANHLAGVKDLLVQNLNNVGIAQNVYMHTFIILFIQSYI